MSFAGQDESYISHIIQCAIAENFVEEANSTEISANSTDYPINPCPVVIQSHFGADDPFFVNQAFSDTSSVVLSDGLSSRQQTQTNDYPQFLITYPTTSVRQEANFVGSLPLNIQTPGNVCVQEKTNDYKAAVDIEDEITRKRNSENQYYQTFLAEEHRKHPTEIKANVIKPKKIVTKTVACQAGQFGNRYLDEKKRQLDEEKRQLDEVRSTKLKEDAETEAYVYLRRLQENEYLNYFMKQCEATSKVLERTHAENKYRTACPTCHKKFKHKTSFENHQKRCCKGKKTKENSVIVDHNLHTTREETETENTGDIDDSETAGKVAINEDIDDSRLDVANDTELDGETTVICSDCGMISSSVADLNEHTNKEHGDIRETKVANKERDGIIHQHEREYMRFSEELFQRQKQEKMELAKKNSLVNADTELVDRGNERTQEKLRNKHNKKTGRASKRRQRKKMKRVTHSKVSTIARAVIKNDMSKDDSESEKKAVQNAESEHSDDDDVILIEPKIELVVLDSDGEEAREMKDTIMEKSTGKGQDSMKEVVENKSNMEIAGGENESKLKKETEVINKESSLLTQFGIKELTVKLDRVAAQEHKTVKSKTDVKENRAKHDRVMSDVEMKKVMTPKNKTSKEREGLMDDQLKSSTREIRQRGKDYNVKCDKTKSDVKEFDNKRTESRLDRTNQEMDKKENEDLRSRLERTTKERAEKEKAIFFVKNTSAKLDKPIHTIKGNDYNQLSAKVVMNEVCVKLDRLKPLSKPNEEKTETVKESGECKIMSPEETLMKKYRIKKVSVNMAKTPLGGMISKLNTDSSINITQKDSGKTDDLKRYNVVYPDEVPSLEDDCFISAEDVAKSVEDMSDFSANFDDSVSVISSRSIVSTKADDQISVVSNRSISPQPSTSSGYIYVPRKRTARKSTKDEALRKQYTLKEPRVILENLTSIEVALLKNPNSPYGKPNWLQYVIDSDSDESADNNVSIESLLEGVDKINKENEDIDCSSKKGKGKAPSRNSKSDKSCKGKSSAKSSIIHTSPPGSTPDSSDANLLKKFGISRSIVLLQQKKSDKGKDTKQEDILGRDDQRKAVASGNLMTEKEMDVSLDEGSKRRVLRGNVKQDSQKTKSDHEALHQSVTEVQVRHSGSKNNTGRPKVTPVKESTCKISSHDSSSSKVPITAKSNIQPMDICKPFSISLKNIDVQDKLFWSTQTEMKTSSSNKHQNPSSTPKDNPHVPSCKAAAITKRDIESNSSSAKRRKMENSSSPDSTVVTKCQNKTSESSSSNLSIKDEANSEKDHFSLSLGSSNRKNIKKQQKKKEEKHLEVNDNIAEDKAEDAKIDLVDKICADRMQGSENFADLDADFDSKIVKDTNTGNSFIKVNVNEKANQREKKILRKRKISVNEDVRKRKISLNEDVIPTVKKNRKLKKAEKKDSDESISTGPDDKELKGDNDFNDKQQPCSAFLSDFSSMDSVKQEMEGDDVADDEVNALKKIVVNEHAEKNLTQSVHDDNVYPGENIDYNRNSGQKNDLGETTCINSNPSKIVNDDGKFVETVNNTDTHIETPSCKNKTLSGSDIYVNESVIGANDSGLLDKCHIKCDSTGDNKDKCSHSSTDGIDLSGHGSNLSQKDSHCINEEKHREFSGSCTRNVHVEQLDIEETSDLMNDEDKEINVPKDVQNNEQVIIPPSPSKMLSDASQKEGKCLVVNVIECTDGENDDQVDEINPNDKQLSAEENSESIMITDRIKKEDKNKDNENISTLDTSESNINEEKTEGNTASSTATGKGNLENKIKEYEHTLVKDKSTVDTTNVGDETDDKTNVNDEIVADEHDAFFDDEHATSKENPMSHITIDKSSQGNEGMSVELDKSGDGALQNVSVKRINVVDNTSESVIGEVFIHQNL